MTSGLLLLELGWSKGKLLRCNDNELLNDGEMSRNNKTNRFYRHFKVTELYCTRIACSVSTHLCTQGRVVKNMEIVSILLGFTRSNFFSLPPCQN